MVDQRERFSTTSALPVSSDFAAPAGATSTRWIAWMPLLFVAAFLYWSVALGLGGLSLMAASAISGDVVMGGAAPDFGATVLEPVSGHVLGDTIVVHLEESAEPEDVNDNAGAAAPNDTVDSADDAIDTVDAVDPVNSVNPVNPVNNDGTGRLPGQIRNERQR